MGSVGGRVRKQAFCSAGREKGGTEKKREERGTKRNKR